MQLFFFFCTIFLILFSNFVLAQTNFINKAISLGSAINSDCYDYRPRISPDGNLLFFTRILCNNPYDQNYLFYSEKISEKEWTKAQKVPMAINDGENPIYVYGIFPGNQKLLITAILNGKRKLCLIEKKGNQWSEPQIIELGVPLPETDVTFCMNNEQNVLLFTYNGKDGISERDLYVSFLREGKWSFPKHTGKLINNGTRILSPFLAADGVTLYYATIREGGMGSWDIYVTKRLDDTWTQWSEPINLGTEVNDEGHNETFSIDALGEWAYFTRNTNSLGGNDIYAIQLKQNLKPNPVVIIKGRVLNKKDNQPVAATLAYNPYDEPANVTNFQTSEPFATYEISLPTGKKYFLAPEAKGYFGGDEWIDLTQVTESKVIQKDLFLTPLETGQTIQLKNIFFDRGRYNLKPESIPELDKLVKLMKDNPNLMIEISGHTNNLGPAEANRILSEKRAFEVRNYLISQRIEPNRIKAIGYGPSRPIGDNNTEEGRNLNQRVEFTIFKN